MDSSGGMDENEDIRVDDEVLKCKYLLEVTDIPIHKLRT